MLPVPFAAAPGSLASLLVGCVSHVELHGRTATHVPGHCGVTSGEGNCSRGAGASGSWELPSLAACKERCGHCDSCNFVSWHGGRRDCSWYSACLRASFAYGGRAYRTLQVRAVTQLTPPPPPPPAFAAPDASGAGYCSLQSPGLGDCERGEQGSWAGVRTPAECIARCGTCARCRFVSFTLANVTEGEHDMSGQPHKHPPYFWRCRWYRHCDMGDLRRSPPASSSTTPRQYVTVARDGSGSGGGSSGGGGRGGGGSSDTAPGGDKSIGRHDEAGAPHRMSIAVTVLLEAQSTIGRGVTHGSTLWEATSATTADGMVIAAEGGMVQWCQNVARLANALPAHWRVDQLVLSEMVGLDTRLHASAGCQHLRRIAVPVELQRLAMRCVHQLQYCA